MYYGPGNGIGPISDIARELLNMKQDKMIWDRHFQMVGAAMGGGGGGGASAAAAKPGGGGGGGGTAVPLQEDPKSRARKDDLADQMFGRGAYSSDKEWDGMMKSATKQVAGQSSGSIGDQIQSNISPMGANGQEIATDQNGGTQQTSGSEQPGEGESVPVDEEEGYTQTADSSSGSSGGLRKGGPVKAGKKYIVGEGGDDEAYVQKDGDVYALRERMGIIPKEDGAIVPNDKLRMMARRGLGRK